MSLARMDGKNRIHRCDACGIEGRWNKSWYSYGSILDYETLNPDDIPTVCSDKCRDDFKAAMSLKKVVVPKATGRGYIVKVVGKRKGY